MNVVYASSEPEYKYEVESSHANARFRLFPDASRWSPIRLLLQFAAISWILLSERPDAIVTTGAAPGYFALLVGKWLGARTVWIDSIANAEELSLSGSKAGRHADLWLTQWEDLVTTDKPGLIFRGRVL